MRSALTIAGSDSSAGAGIQADLKTFAAHGIFGTSAITAITAQNTLGVVVFEAVSAELVTAQIEAVMADIPADAAKTGMLANGGDRLVDADALGALRTELLPRAYLVTPNIPEAEALTGLELRSRTDREEAARRIAAFGASAVLIKGGHLPGDDIVDLLYHEHKFTEFHQARVAGRHTHGTGCTFAAALTAHLAIGRRLEDAVPLAQRYVTGAIRGAPGLGAGHGPMDHFWEGRQLY